MKTGEIAFKHASSSGRKKPFFKKEDITGYLFVAPMLLGICLFVLYPVIQAFLLSLQRTNGIIGKWVGFSNYKYVLRDSNFRLSVINTIVLGALSLVCNITVSFIVASLINSVRWFKNFFKSIYFMPNIVSVVSMSILFSFLLFPTREGLLNYVLGFIGIGPVGWFVDPTFAKIGIVMMGVWSALGYYMLIFLAGLQSVPRELYEASDMDGCTKLQSWRYITIPYIKPVFVFLFMMGTIGAMKRFGDVWMIGGTAGNPNGSLLTVVLYIYRNAFMANEIGLASAASYILFLIILVLTILNNKFLNKSNM